MLKSQEDQQMFHFETKEQTIMEVFSTIAKITGIS